MIELKDIKLDKVYVTDGNYNYFETSEDMDDYYREETGTPNADYHYSEDMNDYQEISGLEILLELPKDDLRLLLNEYNEEIKSLKAIKKDYEEKIAILIKGV